MMQQTTEARRIADGRVHEDILNTLDTDPATAQMKLRALATQRNSTTKEIASQVAQRASDKAFPKDFRANIPKMDSAAATQLFQGMNMNLGPGHETEKAQLQQHVMSLLGVAPDRRQLINAIMADQSLLEQPNQGLSSARGMHQRHSVSQLFGVR